MAWHIAEDANTCYSNSFFKVPVFPLPWSDQARADRAVKAAHSV